MRLTALDAFRALGGVPARGGYLCRCPVPSHGKGKGDRHPSLSVRDGERKLLVHCFAGCTPTEIEAALGARDLSQPAQERVGAVRAAPEPKTTTADALRLWRAGRGLAGTQAEDYLGTRRLPANLPTLRFLPRYRPRSKSYTCLMAALQAPDRQIVAVQLTLLHPTRPEKAPLLRPRLIIGPSRGFALRLGPAAETLGVAEGYETGHAAMLRFGIPVWCSLGAERTPFILFPQTVRRIILFVDPDPAGRRSGDKLRDENPDRDVLVVEPPITGPDDDRDFADFWLLDPTSESLNLPPIPRHRIS